MAKGLNTDAAAVFSSADQWAVVETDCIAGMAAMPRLSVHTVCTSPPYWAQRDYEHPDQIGSEPTAAGYIDSMVRVGRALRDVLRNDGVWWLNIGDTYARNANRGARKNNAGQSPAVTASNNAAAARRTLDRPEGDLLLIPYQVAMALQADGWILRQVVQWCKRSPMPGAPAGKCTAATEPVFMLTKGRSYYYDYLGDPRPLTEATQRELEALHGPDVKADGGNLFNYWELNWWDDIATENNKAKHFAPYPVALARRCIRLTASAYGVCADCGAQWERVVERDRRATRPGRTNKADGGSKETTGNRDRGRHVTLARTTGWQAACECNNPNTVPPVVLDPFVGSGTTIRAALAFGYRAIGLEINPTYAEEARGYIRQKLRGNA